jgi:hypothetical protein
VGDAVFGFVTATKFCEILRESRELCLPVFVAAVSGVVAVEADDADLGVGVDATGTAAAATASATTATTTAAAGSGSVEEAGAARRLGALRREVGVF